VLLKNKEKLQMPLLRVMTRLQNLADDDSKRRHRTKQLVLRKLKPVETARNLLQGNHFVKDPLRMALPVQPPSTLPTSPLSTQTKRYTCLCISLIKKLKELFAAYNPSSAYIVPRQIPRFVIKKLAERGEARKGRGFGFVTFSDEAAQRKAVEEMNGREVESRAISVKVAIDKQERQEDGDQAAAVATNGSS
jgi:hypothetical protein